MVSYASSFLPLPSCGLKAPKHPPLHLLRLDRHHSFRPSLGKITNGSGVRQIWPPRVIGFVDKHHSFRPSFGKITNGSGVRFFRPTRVIGCAKEKDKDCICDVCLEENEGKQVKNYSYESPGALRYHFVAHHNKLVKLNIWCEFCGNFFWTVKKKEKHDCLMWNKARLSAAKEKYGWAIRVKETSLAPTTRFFVAVIRVHFPDNNTIEASFHQFETIQSLYDLVYEVVTHPELPFHLYTTLPKKILEDMSQNFYCAGFVPCGIVYFAYDLPIGDADAIFAPPFLKENVISLKGLEYVGQHVEPSSQFAEPAWLAAVREEFGRDIRVFETSLAPEIAVISVLFPDDHTLEVTFDPLETVKNLYNVVKKVVAKQEMPFYLCTPMKKQLKDMSQDFYSAGFVPVGFVFFKCTVPKGNDGVPFAGPFLKEDVMALKGL